MTPRGILIMVEPSKEQASGSQEAAEARRAASRILFLKLLSQCSGRPAAIDLVDGTSADAMSVVALRSASDEDAVIVVQGLETPIGTAEYASLRACDVVSVSVPLDGVGCQVQQS